MTKQCRLITILLSTIIFHACTPLVPAHNPMSDTSSEIKIAIAQDFQNANTQGVILVETTNGIKITGNQLDRAEQPYIPASTFKILNALIALEHQKTNPNEIFKWDGQPRAYAHWQKDMTMVEAIQFSTVPVYQEIARRVGSELMQTELKRVHYGNEQMGRVIDRFWLDGPLEITPRQSLDFISKLSTNTLPFQSEVQQAVKDMLLIESHANYRLYGKTGWGTAQPYDVGWLVGWIETSKGELIPYVLNMQMKDGMDPNIRKELLIKTLEKLNII